MFNRLRQKWNVNWLQFTLIFITFAVGGSLCGYAGRQLLAAFSVETTWLRIILYIILITLLWPLAVLAVSIPLGQFPFFKNYIGKLFRRLTGRKQPKLYKVKPLVRIAIFASGGGSNAQKIIEHFSDPAKNIKVAVIVCNKPGAGVFDIAQRAQIPVMQIERSLFYSSESYVPALITAGIDFIVLAGFLWKIPDALIKAWPQKIINIHPALLPKYGGKGMYGHFVHEAVLAADDAESGITIHLVDEQYDHGRHLFQARCPVLPDDTPETLAKRVLQLEHQHFSEVIEKVIQESLIAND